MSRLVWAFEPLEETNGQTGFVEIDDDAVADKLIAAGKVQDGWDPEGGELKHVDGHAVDAYHTRQLKAGAPKVRDDPPPKPKPDPDPEPPPPPPPVDLQADADARDADRKAAKAEPVKPGAKTGKAK